MSVSCANVPYWRLSNLYFFYFAVLGALLPYWTLYLKDLGFDAKSIGWLSAILVSTRIVAPNLWGWLADRTGQRLRIVRFGAFMGFMIFLGVFVAENFTPLAVVIFGFSFFWNAILAQFEVITLGHLQSRRDTYSHVRLWGSIGFILAVVLLGVVFDAIAIAHLPKFIACLMCCIWLSSLIIPHTHKVVGIESSERLVKIICQPTLVAFFVVTVLLQVSHAPYYVFFTLYLDDLGYSRTLTGQLWALGVIAEIALFLCMHRVIRNFSLRHILLVSLFLTALRWLLIAHYATELPILILAQCLHAFSFGAIHACSIELIHRYFGNGHAGKGQALYSAASFGLGSAIGASMTGYLWSLPSGPQTAYLTAASIALLSAVIAMVWFRTQHFN